MTSKKDFSERDICTKFITPALAEAGWDIKSQIREEFPFTAGRIIVRGKLYKRGEKKRADYILFIKTNIPLAIIEAKDNNHSTGSGMQQALNYARMLDIPFVYSSNGDGFLEHDRTGSSGLIEKELSLESFPSPAELWDRYKRYKGINDHFTEKIILEDYFTDASKREPRYYQQIAINRTVEAIAKGQPRILLVMATGTGKTYTAFQIIWRLWKSGLKKRILFLADRNALIAQTKRKDFRPFGNKMTIVKHKIIDKSYEIYLALYQGLTNFDEDADAYKEFSPDFFDLVIIDECHRGSADEASHWREILAYFKNATHIGMTATPKETKDVSNIAYFGDPVYTYSLRQGIEDGFLAPYKVIKIGLDRDLEGWRPEKGKTDKEGNLVEDRTYNRKDFDRTLVIDERTRIVANKLSEFLKGTNRYHKTIVFCVDIDHAERMRQALINENPDMYAESEKYVMRITGDDEEGKKELDNFTDAESRYPVIATTSKMLTTGIDATTCHVIVLDSNINSMTEFKQIIGRGTRIDEEFGKYYYTIMDFRNVTALFADPAFDGEPVLIYEPEPDDPIVPEDESFGGEGGDENGKTIDEGQGEGEKRRKVYVNGVEVSVSIERVQYYGNDGKLITESLKDYSRKNLLKEFLSLDDFLTKWSKAEKKKALIDELEEHGVLLSNLKEDTGKDLDEFDLICHMAFDQPPLTRKERADFVKKRNYFTRYGEKAKLVLEQLLEKYADEGIITLESLEVLKLKPIDEFGSPLEIISLFGGKEQYLSALQQLEKEIYRSA